MVGSSLISKVNVAICAVAHVGSVVEKINGERVLAKNRRQAAALHGRIQE
jgi:hypothetical protein